MPLNVNFIYSVTQGGELIEFNPDDGTETILQTGLQTYGDLAVTQDSVLLGFGFVGGIRGQIFTIDPDTGAETLLLDTGQSGSNLVRRRRLVWISSITSTTRPTTIQKFNEFCLTKQPGHTAHHRRS